MRSHQVKEVHTIQEVVKKQKQDKLDKNLTDKFEKRVFETKAKKMECAQGIENLEN